MDKKIGFTLISGTNFVSLRYFDYFHMIFFVCATLPFL